MFFIDSDFSEGDGALATFHAAMKSGGNGSVWVEVYATSGMVSKTPYICEYNYTTSGNGWFQPSVIATNPAVGVLGFSSGTLASGCLGWVKIRGLVEDAQGAATSLTGSIGHAVYWAGATGIGATGSAYVGAAHQVGVLAAYVNESTTGTIYLTGNMYAQSF